jgi:hypothetical protein
VIQITPSRALNPGRNGRSEKRGFAAMVVLGSALLELDLSGNKKLQVTTVQIDRNGEVRIKKGGSSNNQASSIESEFLFALRHWEMVLSLSLLLPSL